jgi:hypothetical protein
VLKTQIKDFKRHNNVLKAINKSIFMWKRESNIVKHNNIKLIRLCTRIQDTIDKTTKEECFSSFKAHIADIIPAVVLYKLSTESKRRVKK